MATAITALPTPPSRADTTNFAARADAFMAALPTFQSEANALSAETWAVYAAVLSQTAAAAGKGTSTTSFLIGTGSKAFTTQAAKGFQAGNAVIISSAANRANWMWGTVVSYASTTLTVNVAIVGGSGTFADWDILIAAPSLTVKVTDFTAAGTWTKDTTKSVTIVQCLGAGGSGGASNTTTNTEPGGGGGGAYAEATFNSADLPASLSILVGAGGTAQVSTGSTALAGQAGGVSQFGTATVYLAAYGGGGGGIGTTPGAAGSGGGGGGLTSAGANGANSSSQTVGAAGGAGGTGVAIITAPAGGAGSPNSTTAASAGTDVESRPWAGAGGGGSGGVGGVAMLGGRGGHSVYGGAGGGGGGYTSAGGPGNGGVSLFGGHGGGAAVSGFAGTGGSGGRNYLVGAAGAGATAGTGNNGGVGSGGGASVGAATATSGAGGRGHVRVIEF